MINIIDGDWGLGIGDWGIGNENNNQYPKNKTKTTNHINDINNFEKI